MTQGCIVLLLFCLFTSYTAATNQPGDCLYQGQVYTNSSVWHTDSCLVCSCQSGVSVCQQVECRNPRCNALLGEKLVLSSTSCCPSCLPKRKTTCQHKGNKYKKNSIWYPQPCERCICDSGEVRCSDITCPDITCKPGQIRQHLPDQCCPECKYSGRECIYKGNTYSDGQTWQPLPCTQCVCKDGHHMCYTAQCQDTDCPLNTTVTSTQDQCCPQCSPVRCTVGKTNYKEGDVWFEDDCTVCRCQSGQDVCQPIKCVPCGKGERSLQQSGRCCPLCVTTDNVCKHRGGVYYNGQVWNTSKCEYCTCNKGDVNCQKVTCEDKPCDQNELLIHPKGRCCSQCVPSKTCNINGSVFKSGESWEPDSCTLCICDKGISTCYSHTCNECPAGSVRHTIPGQCCGPCQQASCSTSHCSSCDPASPSVCLKCSHGYLLHEGECIEKCPAKYFPSISNNCRACHTTCATCSDSSPLSCLSCGTGLVWNNGQCLPQCINGYYNKQGYCKKCSPKCKECNQNGQCKTCRHDGAVLLHGECVDNCPPRYYTKSGRCLACDHHCRTCFLDKAECTSCTSSYAFHHGRCANKCPSGFYRDQSIGCSVCHPSCKTCDGKGPRKCTSCVGRARLRNGACEHGCDVGKYLGADGFCQDCESECSECYPGSKGTSVCTKCKTSSWKLSGSTCVSRCPRSTSEADGACRACPSNCKTCNQRRECKSCHGLKLLWYGECVEHCGPARWPDVANHRCLDCPWGCLVCDGHRCQSCKDGFYLRDGVCTESCSKGFISNAVQRTCDDNMVKPFLQIPHTLRMTVGDVAILNTSMFIIKHTSTQHVKLRLPRVPSTGTILYSNQQKLKDGSQVSWEDLVENKVRFYAKTPGKDAVGIVVDRGDHHSNTAQLIIHVKSNQKLSISQNEKLVVKLGESVKFDKLVLTTTEHGGDIQIKVLHGPQHGYLSLSTDKSQSVSSFTSKQLEGGEVWYKHDGTASTTDTMLLQITDGQHTVNVMCDVTIKIMNEDLSPVMINNEPAEVEVGGLIQITAKLLSARAASKQSKRLMYVLTPPHSNPSHGELIMIVPIPESGRIKGWEDMGDNKMASRMYRFLQRDLDEGRIWYRMFKGSKTQHDSLQFQISDALNPPNILKDQSFVINVIKPQSDQAAPTVAPGVRLGMTVYENQLVPITTDDLAYTDIDTEDRDIVYSITRPLLDNQGTIELIERPFEATRRFSQEDINRNMVIYRPPVKELGSKEKEFSFYFYVSDRASGQNLPEQKFTIVVQPVNNMPPVINTANAKVEVMQSGMTPIGRLLSVSDPDTSVDDLLFSLVDSPRTGQIMKTEGGLRAVLRPGDHFTYGEISKNVFFYQHDGSDRLTDNLEFMVNDGAHDVPIRLAVKVNRVDKRAPMLVQGSTLSIDVKEGDSIMIQRRHLAFADEDTNDEGLKYTIVSALLYGELSRDGSERLNVGSSFTQEDIDQGKISYLSTSEIGSQDVIEQILFNVTDTSANALTNQILTMVIQPVNNQAPMATVGDGIQVLEGGVQTFTQVDISVMDIDTAVRELMIVMEQLPKFGVVENIKPVVGSEKQTPVRVTSFPVQDLNDGFIQYSQMNHQHKEPVADGFLFYVTDGTNQSPTSRFNISIILTNDEPPTLVTEQVFVQENRGVVLTNATLYVRDFDTTPDDLIFTIIKQPTHGSIRRLNFPQDMKITGMVLLQGDTFTYENILDELVVYTHEGLEVTGDELSLSITDGQFNDTKTVYIRIGLVNDETPRIDINRGLTVKAGSVTKITSSVLKASDLDSDDSILIFMLTQNPSFGRVRLYSGDGRGVLNADGQVNRFQQTDLVEGNIEYVHLAGEETGVTFFKFSVADSDGNMLIDQTFTITVTEDHTPPTVLTNKGLTVTEGAAARLSTTQLSSTDVDSEPGNLKYILYTVPDKGHLELVTSPGVPITEFTQSDIAANLLQYVHSSEEEVYMDMFTFAVTDGSNEVTQTFRINILPVDDSLPMVTSHGLRVQEGVRKIITEFELKAEDLDTKEDQVTFQIVRPPTHGVVELKDGEKYTAVTYFKMSDIYENRVSYNHDGSETIEDSFDFLVTDGAHSSCTVMRDGVEVVSGDPLYFNISIQPVDDGAPILEVNLGLHYLEYVNNVAMNVITKRELQAKDHDTPDEHLYFQVTKRPSYGYLERADRAGVSIKSFTQDDLNNANIRYVLTSTDYNISTDAFVFSLADSKPNLVQGFTFYITWSLISFEKPSYNVTEKGGLISIPVRRTGNLKQYSVVDCSTKPGSATSSGVGTQPGQRDFVEHSGQVQFDEWQTQKTCTIIINDDSIFEGPERFTVHLSQPAYALLGHIQSTEVTVYDVEDEPIIQFEDAMYFVNESDGYVRASMLRSGDITTSVSVLCLTKPLTAKGSGESTLESGSDYKTRGRSHQSRVTFLPGVTRAECVVQIIDDSAFEPSEQFEIHLSEPSMMTKIGPRNQAVVVIEGPNDESVFFFPHETYHVNENAGKLQIPVVRRGADLSHTSMVWCATRMTEPPSATPGQDYVPSSKQVTFEPGQLIKNCELTILDDEADVRMEGNESLTVFLSSPMGSLLSEPYTASVVINDTHLDMPTMQFEFEKYIVDEEDGHIDVPIIRTGDLSYESSVICYTRQNTAQVMMDYDERMLTEQSRIVFLPGEKVKMCRVGIVNDKDAEEDEKFHLKLSHPVGTQECEARIGFLDTTEITIINPSDTPTIFIEKAGYSINEPGTDDKATLLVVKILRTGDLDQASKVRCSTRDGSALSGDDYNPKSKVLNFKKGVSEILFKVEILYNQETEWHETFSIQLGPSEPVNAILGEISVATVTILDHQVSGSLVLPAPPVVVSLLSYDHVEDNLENNPSPGYPIVCVTPCDSRYPTYTTTKFLCDEAGINQTAMQYAWEVSMPTDEDGARPPFETVTDNTLFTTTNHMVLESIYFRPGFIVRCVAQPVHNNGNIGIPLRSGIVEIGIDNGLCRAPIIAGNPHGLQSQSFVANLKYVNPSDDQHPNRIKISIQVPHQDGMLPLISTLPLHNLRFLLSEPIYRQQHVCSNIITPSERSGITESGFLNSVSTDDTYIGPGFDRPYQFDGTIREHQAIDLYRHLNLKSCVWTFDAWFHMSELIDICGGSVVSNFKVRDAGHTYLTVSVPLYVSYVYALAPTGWASMEHRTEMKFSFFYESILWRSGLETEGKLSGKLQVLKIAIGQDGKLEIDFKTKTKFRGQYVLSHHTLPDFESRVVPPEGVGVTFDLVLLWGQPTFDGPDQLWRATSNYNLKDYSGDYVIELLPCSVSSTQSYHKVEPLACTAHKPQRFVVPIGFQQTNRPVPLEYSLNTHFQIQNHEKMFLMNPDKNDITENDYQGAFTEGQIVFGRVLWSPSQSLNTAYKLRIEKVFICTGDDGYVPTYDPTGDLYNEGPQFGCLQPNGRLKHRFLILDRGAPHAATPAFHNVDFKAQLASDNHKYLPLQQMPGVDGFSFNVDPLFKVEAGHQWYIQVLYIIGPADKLHSYRLTRNKRDADDNLSESLLTGEWINNKATRNGTNIKFIKIDLDEVSAQVKTQDQNYESANIVAIVAPSVVGFVVIVLIIVGVIAFVKLRQIKAENMSQATTSNARMYEKNSAANNLDNYYSELKKQNTIDSKNINSSMGNIPSSYSGINSATVSRVKQKKLHIVHNRLNDNGTEV